MPSLNLPPACASSGCNAPEGECLGLCMPPATTSAAPVKCTVKVRTPEDDHTYTGLFACTIDAAIDALERFADATRINVRKVPA